MVNNILKNSECLSQWHTHSPLKRLTCFVCLALILGLSGEVLAVTTSEAQTINTPNKETQEETTPNLEDMLRSDFVYQRGKRPDPFVPFVSEQTLTEQIQTEEEALTGMRLFEPGQLNLVAISSDGLAPLALVQDSTGKGYILKEGISIGRRGIIKSIVPNAVIIEESFLSSAGKKRNRTIEMILRKEGEK